MGGACSISVELSKHIHLQNHSISHAAVLAMYVYSDETSEQRTLWDQYKFKWLVKRFQSILIGGI